MAAKECERASEGIKRAPLRWPQDPLRLRLSSPDLYPTPHPHPHLSPQLSGLSNLAVEPVGTGKQSQITFYLQGDMVKASLEGTVKHGKKEKF